MEQAVARTVRRRHTRRRGAILAVIVVASAVVVACQVSGDDRGDVRSVTASPTVAADDGEKVWPGWDPHDAHELPAAPDRTAPALPDVIDPPNSSPSLRDHPLDAGVLVHERDGIAQVLGVDGGWRTIRLHGAYPEARLSPDGTRVVVYDIDDSRGPATVHTLATGAVDVVRAISMDSTGRLTAIQANGELVVGTSYDGRPFSLVLADRATLTPRTSLPLRDHDSNYSNGGLGVLALRDDGTVLFRVAVFGRGGGFRVVAWDPSTGEISLVSRTLRDARVSFADGLLRS